MQLDARPFRTQSCPERCRKRYPRNGHVGRGACHRPRRLSPSAALVVTYSAPGTAAVARVEHGTAARVEHGAAARVEHGTAALVIASNTCRHHAQ